MTREGRFWVENKVLSRNWDRNWDRVITTLGLVSHHCSFRWRWVVRNDPRESKFKKRSRVPLSAQFLTEISVPISVSRVIFIFTSKSSLAGHNTAKNDTFCYVRIKVLNCHNKKGAPATNLTIRKCSKNTYWDEANAPGEAPWATKHAAFSAKKRPFWAILAHFFPKWQNVKFWTLPNFTTQKP